MLWSLSYNRVNPTRRSLFCSFVFFFTKNLCNNLQGPFHGVVSDKKGGWSAQIRVFRGNKSSHQKTIPSKLLNVKGCRSPAEAALVKDLMHLWRDSLYTEIGRRQGPGPTVQLPSRCATAAYRSGG